MALTMTMSGRRRLMPALLASLLVHGALLAVTAVQSYRSQRFQPAQFSVGDSSAGLSIRIEGGDGNPDVSPAALPEPPLAGITDIEPTIAPEMANLFVALADTNRDLHIGQLAAPFSSASTARSGGPAKRGSSRGNGLPAYMRNPPPPYPRTARERGWEGTVLLHVEVLANGTAGSVITAQSSGYRVLDESAADTVRDWRFQPAQSDGTPVPSLVEIPITFRMANN